MGWQPCSGGAPIATFDLDVVHARSRENFQRLASALDDLDAHYRDPAGRDLRPQTTALSEDGHHLLLTRCGPVDVLGAIGHGRRYEHLLLEAVSINLGDFSVNVLGLAALRRVLVESKS